MSGVSDWEFAPEDFKDLMFNAKGMYLAGKMAQEKLQEWLASALPVYTINSLHEMDSFTVRKTPMTEGYKALLIKIEEIKKCDHPKEKIRSVMHQAHETFAGRLGYFYQCECGQRVKPSAWEECE